MSTSKKNETLHDCPECGTKNFTAKGLASHNCAKHKARNQGGTALATPVIPAARKPLTLATLDAMPLAVVSGDAWTRARKWVDAAGAFDRGKLACQVMAGFELHALRKEHGISQGTRTDLPNRSGSWPELVKQRLGISDDTARNWMAMAEKAEPRIKKLGGAAALEEILARPASDWDAAEMQVVQTTVAKLADGKTQLDFMRELGLERGPVKSRGGARSAGPGKDYDPTAPIENARDLILHPLRDIVCRWREKEEKLPRWAHLPPEELREIDAMLMDLRNDMKAALKK